MKAYPSIEQLAEDVGISERTGWRWLKTGKIKKKRSENGQIVFILTDKSTNITDIGVTDNVTTDVSGDVTDINSDIGSVSNRRELRDKNSHLSSLNWDLSRD